jgi:hypothetical protein
MFVRTPQVKPEHLLLRNTLSHSVKGEFALDEIKKPASRKHVEFATS